MPAHHLCVFALLLSAAVAWAPPASRPYQSPGMHQHVGPTNVLVIYNTAWPDADGNGRW